MRHPFNPQSSVCSVLLHRVVLTDGPLLRADASDLSNGDSSLTGGVIVPQPPQSVTRLLARLKKCNIDLQLCKLSIVFFRRSVGRRQLANNSTRQCVKSPTCTWPQEPWVNGVSPSTTSQHLCASETFASAATAAQENRVRHNCFAGRCRHGDSERAIALKQDRPKKIRESSSEVTSSSPSERSSVPSAAFLRCRAVRTRAVVSTGRPLFHGTEAVHLQLLQAAKRRPRFLPNRDHAP